MDVREKLVELVDKARRYAANKCHSFMACAECDHYGEHDGNCRNTYIAESLIANGVTVQEWISVKDRLPEEGTKALCYLKRGEYWTAVWDDCGDDLWSDGEAWCSNGEVTHWMPLPPAPKGE